MGYPNTGKSSLINYLKGKKSAKTSITAGFTRGEQIFRISERAVLIDTPGVIPFMRGGEAKLALMASKSPQDLQNPVFSAQKVLQEMQSKGAEAIILGCTDLFLLVSPPDVPLPLINSTQILENTVIEILTSNTEALEHV